jgi:hypothetical protein
MENRATPVCVLFDEQDDGAGGGKLRAKQAKNRVTGRGGQPEK